MALPAQDRVEVQPIARELSRLVRDAVGQVFRVAAQGDDAPAPLLLDRAGEASGPRQLASSHKGAVQQREALALYRRCLAHYRSAIQPRIAPDSERDDLGRAAAYFVLANLAAVQGSDLDELTLAAVTAQLCRLIALTDAWQRAPLARRQAWFEQLALLGVLVNEARLQARGQGAAAVANVQRAARGYLMQLLGLDPELLLVTPQGLAAATAVH